MDTNLYPPLSKELARKRTQLAPEISAAFKAYIPLFSVLISSQLFC